MRLPRDVSADRLVKVLGVLGYEPTRQTGSHIRLTTNEPSEHHLTIPNHDPIRVGTLNAIFRQVAAFHGISRDELLRRLKL